MQNCKGEEKQLKIEVKQKVQVCGQWCIVISLWCSLVLEHHRSLNVYLGGGIKTH